MQCKCVAVTQVGPSGSSQVVSSREYDMDCTQRIKLNICNLYYKITNRTLYIAFQLFIIFNSKEMIRFKRMKVLISIIEIHQISSDLFIQTVVFNYFVQFSHKCVISHNYIQTFLLSLCLLMHNPELTIKHFFPSYELYRCFLLAC